MNLFCIWLLAQSTIYNFSWLDASVYNLAYYTVFWTHQHHYKDTELKMHTGPAVCNHYSIPASHEEYTTVSHAWDMFIHWLSKLGKQVIWINENGKKVENEMCTQVYLI